MEKLIEKFENNYNQIRTLGVPIEVIFEQNKKVATINAEECKEVAIAFARYIKEDNDIEYIGDNKYQVIIEAEGECFSVTMTEETLFSNFIDEYYKEKD